MDKERMSALPYYFQNWLILNKTPLYQWETHLFRKNTLLVCLEIYEELEQKLRTEHIAIKMDLKEMWDDRDILCTVQAAAECRKLAVAYLDSIGYNVKISRSGKKESISVTFPEAGKAVWNRHD